MTGNDFIAGTAPDPTAIARRLHSVMGEVIARAQDAVELLLVALFANGHVLLLGVPGIGKTTLRAVEKGQVTVDAGTRSLPWPSCTGGTGTLSGP